MDGSFSMNDFDSYSCAGVSVDLKTNILTVNGFEIKLQHRAAKVASIYLRLCNEGESGISNRTFGMILGVPEFNAQQAVSSLRSKLHDVEIADGVEAAALFPVDIMREKLLRSEELQGLEKRGTRFNKGLALAIQKYGFQIPEDVRKTLRTDDYS